MLVLHFCPFKQYNEMSGRKVDMANIIFLPQATKKPANGAGGYFLTKKT